MVKINLKLIDNDKIKNFEKHLEFIADALRMTEYSLCGWMLLKTQIENIKIYHREYNVLMKYMNDKSELFKKTIVSCINILNGKYNGNLNDAKLGINISTKICWTINKLIPKNKINSYDMIYFNELYTKI